MKHGSVPCPTIFPFYIQSYHMKDFIVSVRKLTDEALMREACEMTFLGESHQSLLSIYKSEHSPVRTQIFWITLKNIPLYISTHLIRHHVGSIPFQLTCRNDRPGGDPGLPAKVDAIKAQLTELLSHFHKGGVYTAVQHEEWTRICDELDWLKDNSDRKTPVNLGICVNAQSLIDMAKLRLCSQASEGTRIVFRAVKEKISEVDPDLAQMMVPKCIYRGSICGEPRCCGFNGTPKFREELKQYLSHFNSKQRGLLNENCN